jgi:hypothetical protein
MLILTLPLLRTGSLPLPLYGRGAFSEVPACLAHEVGEGWTHRESDGRVRGC